MNLDKAVELIKQDKRIICLGGFCKGHELKIIGDTLKVMNKDKTHEDVPVGCLIGNRWELFNAEPKKLICFLDGDNLCIVDSDFINLQESKAMFIELTGEPMKEFNEKFGDL